MRLEDVATSPHFQQYAPLAEPETLPPGAAAGLAADPMELARRVEDPCVPLRERLVAGGVLGLIGDPRITPEPAVCAIPGGVVDIGLPPDGVADVLRRWGPMGVIGDWIEKETPRHQVVLDDFWIAKYPVTNAEYREFLRATGHGARPTTWYLGAYPWERSNHPVAGVTAADADAFVAWFSARTGHPWRLATEPEWEYAAGGPAGLEFPWGDDFDPCRANLRETGVHTTTPVGAFPGGRSPFGVFDLAGNVEEYVADDYAPYPGGPYIADHLVQTMGGYRVTRGGSFSRFGDLARTRRRHGAFPGPLYPVGLRLATGVRP